MHEIITVTKLGKSSTYYEVASTQRQDGTKGSLGAFTGELEALQFANRHTQQHRGTPYNAELNLSDEQRHLLDHGAAKHSEALIVTSEAVTSEEL